MKRMMTAAALCLCLALCGCSGLGVLQAARRAAAEGKEKYTVTAEEPARLEGEAGPLWVLEKAVDAQRRGAWVGTVECWLVVDETGRVLGQTPVGELEAVQALCGETPAQVVAYYNIYEDAQTSGALLVDIDGALHPLGTPQEGGLFAPKAAPPQEEWRLGDDCRVLVKGEKQYRVTETPAPEGGVYLGMIARAVVFDADTGREIPREELTAIEGTPGRLSRQRRVQRTYGAIYSVPGEESAVAVEVDGALLTARLAQDDP